MSFIVILSLPALTILPGLGYGAAWLLEHHFSDYYPTPGPRMTRFAEEICPRYSSAMRKGRAA